MNLYRVFKVIDRLREIYKGTPVGWPHNDLQAKWVRRTTDEIQDWSYEARGRTGMTLYCRLPEEIQKKVYKLSHDPYGRHMSRFELEDWLTNHIFFDQYGDMVIFHNYGEIIWQAEDFDIDPRFEMIYGKAHHG